MNPEPDQIEFLKTELNKKNIELENSGKLMSKVLRERDVSLKYNNELRNQLELMSAKLHLHQNVIKTITNSIAIQTDLTLISEKDVNDSTICCRCFKSMSSSQSENNQTIDSNSWKQKSEKNNTRISDLVRETAQEVVSTNDYCYDEKSKTYYSRSSGWYYYPV